MLVLGWTYGLELVDHVLQEQQRPVVHTRESGTKAAGKAPPFVLPLDLLLLLLPVHPERGIGEKIIERLCGELVLREAVAKADVITTTVVVDLLHQHVGRGSGESALVVVLPIHVD